MMNINSLKSFFSNIRKTVKPEELVSKSENNGLKKSLSAFDLIILGISAIVGCGIFVMIGPAVCGSHGNIGAGPSVVISIILAAIVCICPALCYAEFAAIIPVSGSVYTYTYATLGEFAAWVIGWILLLEYAISDITIAVSWTDYLLNFLKGFENILPAWLVNPPIWLVNDIPTAINKCNQAGLNCDIELPHIFGIPVSINLPAMLIVFVLGLILLKGIQESTKAAATMVIVKLAVILIFVGVGIFYVQPENWTPFAPSGISGIVLSTFIIFYAYIGFDTISTAAEETKNPQKNLPIGLIGSLVVCSILYALVAIVFTGIIPIEKYSDVDILAPMAYAVRLINQPWIAGWISLGALAGLTSALLIFQYGNTRILYSMGRDNFLPKSLTKIDNIHKTPYIATWITTLAVMLGCIFMDANVAAELGIFGTLTCFIMVCVGVIIMRFKNPDIVRPFKVPFFPWLPLIGILVCGYLIITVIPQLKVSSLLFPLWIFVGCIIYFSYGYGKNRQVEQKNNKNLSIIANLEESEKNANN
ncbi:amino acid permease [bacterium]|nr:amino acid permease [bacterium]